MNTWFEEGSIFEYGTGSTTGVSYDVIHVAQVKTKKLSCSNELTCKSLTNKFLQLYN